MPVVGYSSNLLSCRAMIEVIRIGTTELVQILAALISFWLPVFRGAELFFAGWSISAGNGENLNEILRLARLLLKLGGCLEA